MLIAAPVETVGALGAVTVSVVFPEILPDVAVMVLEPAATAVASPEALIVAFAASEELHVADAVMSCVLPSE